MAVVATSNEATEGASEWPASTRDCALVALTVSALFALLIGAIAAYGVGRTTGVVVGALTLVPLFVYSFRFLRIEPAAGARRDLPSDATPASAERLLGPVCASCGARFLPGRSNQRYCSPSCRARAASERRRNGRSEAEAPHERSRR